MERQASNASKAMLAMVVREFSPSRIERQLLTQAFEYVVTVHRADDFDRDELNSDPLSREEMVDVEDSITTIGIRSAA